MARGTNQSLAQSMLLLPRASRMGSGAVVTAEIDEHYRLIEKPGRLKEIIETFAKGDEPQQALADLQEFVLSGSLTHLEENFQELSITDQEWTPLLNAAKKLLTAADREWELDLDSPLAENVYRSARRVVRTLEKARNLKRAARNLEPFKKIKLTKNPQARANDPERLAANAAKAQLKTEEKKREHAEKVQAAILALDPEVRQALDESRARIGNDSANGTDFFHADLWQKLNKYGELSPAQLAAVKKNIASRKNFLDTIAARKAAQASAPILEAGRRVIEGVVFSDKEARSDYSGELVHNLTIELDDKNTLWGVAARSLYEQLTPEEYNSSRPFKGLRLRMTATVKPKDGDDHFGYFKNPRNAEIIR